MAFCGNCGAQTQEGVNFCPSCGQAMGESTAVNTTTVPPSTQQATPAYVPPVAPGEPQTAEMKDAQDGKTMAILSYIFFFVPLLSGAHKTSPFVKYHTNQGTLLALVAIAYSIVSSILSAVITVEYTVWGVGLGYRVTPSWLSAILGLLCIPIVVGVILGIMNAVNGQMKPLPVIGKYTIVK